MEKLKYLYEIYKRKCPENQIVYRGITKKRFDYVFEKVAFAFDDTYFYVFWNLLIRKYKYWWVPHFAQSTYYHYRSVVVDSFNFLFDAVV